MVVGNDRVVEFKVSRDIDMPLVNEDTGIAVPVRQLGTESRGNFWRVMRMMGSAAEEAASLDEREMLMRLMKRESG